MKSGLFIEPYDYREVVLKNKGPIYFVDVDRSIKNDDILEKDFFEDSLFSPSLSVEDKDIPENEHVFYVKCFGCESEYFLCINDSVIANDFKDENYLLELRNSFNFKAKLNLPKSITRTNDEKIIEKVEETSIFKKLKKIGFVCPCCKEDKFNISCRKSTNIFLNENEKYFQIKSYGIAYVTKNTKINKITKLNYAKDYIDELKIVSIKHSVQIIFDKLSNNVYLRYSDGGKYKLINGENAMHHHLHSMNLKNEEIFISFIKDMLRFYHSKFNKYQKKSLDFTKEINETHDVADLMAIFEKIKYHLNFPFAFEVFGEEINRVISRDSKYFRNKSKAAKSGDELLNIYFNPKGLTKKIRKTFKENSQYFNYKDKKFNYYKYQIVLHLAINHDNKGLNQLIFNHIISNDGYIELNRNAEITHPSNGKYISYKKMYNYLKEYILIDNILKDYMKSDDLFNYNRYIRDTVNLILLIEEFLKKNVNDITANQRKAIIEAKKVLKIIKANKNLSLKKLHDKLMLLHDEIDTVFEEYYYTEEEEQLNYKKGDISIKLYKNSIQLKQSARKLKICAYSYSNRIKNKEIVLFELKQIDKEKMCIEVVGDKVVQAKLNSNQLINDKTPISIINTLKEWIKSKELTIATNDLSYIS